MSILLRMIGLTPERVLAAAADLRARRERLPESSGGKCADRSGIAIPNAGSASTSGSWRKWNGDASGTTRT